MEASISLRFSSAEEALRYLELLRRHVGADMHVTTRLGHVYIKFEGDREAVERAVRVARELAGAVRGGRRARRVPLEVLLSDAKLASPVPPEVLAELLRATGHTARLKGAELVTDAEYGEVLKAAEALSRIYKELEPTPLTAQAKRVVAVYSAARGLPPEAAVEELARAGLLTRGKVVGLAKPLDSALREALRLLGR